MRKKIEELVYGKRHKLAILKRRIEYKYFSFVRHSHTVDISRKGNYVLLYPSFNNNDIMNDILNRATWSFPANSSIKIYYTSDIKLNVTNLPYQHSFLKDHITNNNSNLEKVSSDRLKELMKDAKAILVWNKKSRYEIAKLTDGAKTIISDPWYYSLEECNGMKFGLYNILSNECQLPFFRTVIN